MSHGGRNVDISPFYVLVYFLQAFQCQAFSTSVTNSHARVASVQAAGQFLDN